MSKKFLVGIDATAGVSVSGGNVTVSSGYLDLNKNELRNAQIQNLTGDPSTPVAGQIYYNSSTGVIKYYDGDTWETLATGSTLTFAAPSTLAAGGTNTEGVSTSAARADHIHALPAFGSVTAQTSYGASSANGSATTFARSDHTHGTPSLTNDTPTTQAIGDTAAVGTATTPARADHKHAMPAFGNVTTQTSFGSSGANGTSADLARADHTHGTPAHDATAHASIKISDLAAPTASVSFNSQKITNLATPTSDSDAATKEYVDATAQGLHVHTAVRLATAAALPAYTYNNGTSGVGATITGTASGALTVDGTLVAVSDRILVKDEVDANAPYNGVYVVTATGGEATSYVLTRAADLNQGAEFPGAFEFVTSGTANADNGYVCVTEPPVTVGTTPIEFVQFSGAGQITAGTGLTKTGNTINAGAGTGIVVNTDTIAVDRTTNGAKVALIYTANVGDGEATSYTVTHNLGSRDVGVSIYDNSSPYAEVVADVEHTSTSAVTIKFAAAPASNKYRVVVFG